MALSELLQNSLTHRSWLKPVPIRILIFDDRVEIISPGCLPNNLTVEDIKLGIAFQRNQLIANLCAKTMDYRGLGSGIIRALKADANIEFRNEALGDQFRAILWRNEQKTTQKAEHQEKGSEKTTQKVEDPEKGSEKTTQKVEGSEKGSEKTRDKILVEISKDSEITIAELANKLLISDRAVSKHLKRLQESGKFAV